MQRFVLHVGTRTPLAAALVLGMLFAGCSDDPSPPDGAHAVFLLPRDGVEHAFFDLPWPTDLRRQDNGNIDVSDFPQPREIPIVQQYMDAIDADTGGYSLNGCMYARFSESIDESTLPQDALEAQADTASVFVMNVDPDSADLGLRHPVALHYQDTATRYWPDFTLAVRPSFGAALSADTTYALVVTNGVRPAAGGEFVPDEDMWRVLTGNGGDADVQAARALYTPALDQLEAQGVDIDTVINLAVFTTNDVYDELSAARDFIVNDYTLPTADAGMWTANGGGVSYTEVRGTYGPSPIFQQGTVPYMNPTQGGDFVVTNGVPQVQGTFDARFALAIPTSPMPTDGYPIVIYQHGTGGDYRTFIRNGVAEDLTAEGIAVIGVDGLHHGDRAPAATMTALAVFNVLNPYSLRDNNRQSALDIVQEARLIPGLAVPTAVTGRMVDVTFDETEVYYFGHSQGGTNGPLYLAVDNTSRAAVLSGAGAVILVPLVDKSEPEPAINGLFDLILGLPGVGQDALDMEAMVYEHPIFTLLQTWVDRADTASYAHMISHDPPAGQSPIHVLQTIGTTDLYSPPRGLEALAAAGRWPQVTPTISANPGLTALGVAPVAPPVTGNMSGTTVGNVQYDGGHFVSFQVPEARQTIIDFFSTAATNGTPTISAGSPP